VSKDKVLPETFQLDDKIAEEVNKQLLDNCLSCAVAHAIAKRFDVSPSEIGYTADALGIRLNRCQLGLFGFPNKKGWDQTDVAEMPIPELFAQELRDSAPSGTLSCLHLWELAAKHHVPRMQAGYIAEKLGIRIDQCQLGAF
jgi:hypothetical protein